MRINLQGAKKTSCGNIRSTQINRFRRYHSNNKKLKFEPLEDRRLLSVAVGNLVWNDLNGNGIQDAGEPGIAGVGVELYSSTDATTGNGDDVLRGRAVTDANGNYSISNVPDGLNLFEVFRSPGGFTFASKDVGDDALDSDVDSTGTTSLFTISAGQTDATRDAGLVGSMPGFGFAMSAGGTNGDSGLAVTADAAGNIFETGNFEGTLDFDPGPGVYNLTSGGSCDVFVAKYSPSGALIWARRLGGANAEYGRGIVVAADGSVYTTGNFNGSADFDPGSGTYNLTSAGLSEIFVSKLDSAGNFVWARRQGGSGTDAGENIALASDGSICITGTFQGTADFDPAASGTYNLTSVGNYDVFITKLDSAGNFVWACGTGGTNYDYATGIAVASDGSVYATGYYQDTVDFDPGTGSFPLTSVGGRDFFVLKLNSTGSFVWAKSMGGTGSDTCLDIALGPDGGVYTTGYFSGTADFDPGPGTFNLSGTGAFISKLDSQGNFVWARELGGTSSTTAEAIAVTADGYVYTTGYFYETADFDPGVGTFNLQSAGNSDIFISKLDSSGTFFGARSMGGTGSDIGYAIAITTGGSSVITGYFEVTADFDPSLGIYNLTSAGSRDRVLAKILPDITPTIPPSVTGTDPAPESVITSSETNFDITFSKDVRGVDATDFVLTGDAAALAVVGTPLNILGSTWRFPVSGLINGALHVSLAPDVNDISDLSGNTLANSDWNYTAAIVPSNFNPITLPIIGVGSPYPSTINVAGLFGTITDVNVTLKGLTHSWPEDIDILLVGPAGQKVVILSDVGSGNGISSVNLSLDDSAATYLTTAKITSGTFKPTNLGASDTFTSPAPTGPYLSTLAAFNGTNPNGTWKLYVIDDASPDSGSIAGGWSLAITTNGGTAIIGDTVFNDLNSNGIQDSGEPGVANWVVYLDSNTNGQWDSGEPKTATDINGNYAFKNLGAGVYRVAEVQRTGWTQTSPASPGYYSITVADGETRSDVDFGNCLLPHQDFSIIASVDGNATDADLNGVFDSLTTTGAMIDVGCYTSTGDQRGIFEFPLGSLVSAGTVVDASFSFNVGIKMGGTGAKHTYALYGYAGDGVVSLSDATVTATFLGNYQASDAGWLTIPIDAAFIQSLSGTTNYVGLMLRSIYTENASLRINSLEYGSGVSKPTLSLSTLLAPSAEIRSNVWNDLDADGIQDPVEPGVAGVSVEIYFSSDATVGNSDDVLVAHTVTDSAGNYTISNLTSSKNYYLVFRAPVGLTFTAKDAGSNDLLDSDADSTGVTSIFKLSGEQTDFSRDAGLLGTLPSFGYALRLGATYDDSGESVAIDPEGNLCVVGWLGGTSDFDPGPGVFNPPFSGSSGAFVAKYASTGALIWARRFGGLTYDLCWGQGVDVGNDGSIYITGRFKGTSDFDPGASVFNLTASGNSYDVFVSKLDAEGNFIWARSFGSTTKDDFCYGIVVANDGSVYTTGTFEGTGDFNPGSETETLTSRGETDIFISKLDSTGNFIWAKSIGGLSYDQGAGIGLDGLGNVYTTGYFIGSVDFDPGEGTINPTSYGTYDIFVSKMSPQGNLLWARSMGGSAIDLARGIAVENNGDVYTTGYFSSRADFDPGDGEATFNSAGEDDVFISKLNADGNFVWARRLGGTQSESGYDIAVAEDGNVFATGTYSGTVDFDPGPGIFNLTNTARFLTKLDADGNFVMASPDGGKSIDVAGDGSVYATGYFWGTYDFDPGPGTFNISSCDSYHDIFVSKLLPDHAPTNITIASGSFAENKPAGTIVGAFSSVDQDAGEAFTYSLVAGTGSDDNALFTINASGQLVTAAMFDFEAKSSFSIRVRTVDYSGMWYEKVFAITVTDVPDPFVVGAANWTTTGLTVKIGEDGKLHAYQTGTTIDIVPPYAFSNVSDIQITGRGNDDDVLTVDFSSGVPIPAGGLKFNGDSHINGDTILIKGTTGNDQVTFNRTQIIVAGVPALGFSNVEFFGFDLVTGTDTLLIDHTTLRIDRNNAISASTNVTVDGGTLDFNGNSSTIGNLVLQNNGIAIVNAINNATTKVTSGTLAATSIICDTLTIGPPPTRTWDGGGTDNKWSTAANWDGDVAPKPGDILVFPAGVAKLESMNDYPAGTVFDSINVSGGNYRFQNGITSSGVVQVTSGTLTTSSIVCDTLTIGSASKGNNAAATSFANNPVAETPEVLYSIASDQGTSTITGNAVIDSDAIGSPACVDQLQLDQLPVVSPQATPATSAEAPRSVSPAISALKTESIDNSMMQTEWQDSEADIVEPHRKEWFTDVLFVDLNLTKGTSFINPFRLTDRLKDSVHENSTASLTWAKKHPSIVLTESQSARSLALQSLTRDYQHNFEFEQIDPELINSLHSCKQNKLVKERHISKLRPSENDEAV
jgi:subtilisin-like proprotein convertase family protein